jgi:hypothetical protein
VTEAERQLIAALAAEARGPRRNGLFALWLLTRTAEALLPPDPVTPRGHRRRMELLQRRLASLSVPAPLRRALSAALRQVGEGSPQGTALALSQLVAPARETVGERAAAALAAAAARARQAAIDGEPR